MSYDNCMTFEKIKKAGSSYKFLIRFVGTYFKAHYNMNITQLNYTENLTILYCSELM